MQLGVEFYKELITDGEVRTADFSCQKPLLNQLRHNPSNENGEL